MFRGSIRWHFFVLATSLLVLLSQSLALQSPAQASSSSHDQRLRRKLGHRDHSVMTPLQQGTLLLVLSGRGSHVTSISSQLEKPHRTSVASALRFLESKGYVTAASWHERGRIDYEGTPRGFEALDAALGRRGLAPGVGESPEELTRRTERLSATLRVSDRQRVAVSVWDARPNGESSGRRRVRLRYLSVPDLVKCLENLALPVPEALAVTPEALSVLYASSRGAQSTPAVAEYTGLSVGGTSWRILQQLTARRLVERRRVGRAPTEKGEAVYDYPLTLAGQWALTLGLVRGGLPSEIFHDPWLVSPDPRSTKGDVLASLRDKLLSSGPPDRFPKSQWRADDSEGRPAETDAVQTANRLSVLYLIPEVLPAVDLATIQRATGLPNVSARNATESLAGSGFIERIADSLARTRRFAFVRGAAGSGLLRIWQQRRGLAPGLAEMAASQLRDKHGLGEGIAPIDWLSRALLTGQAVPNLVFPARRWTPEFTSVVLATFINPHLGLEPMTHAQIQEYTGVAGGTVSNGLKALVQAGFLERQTSAGSGWGAAKWLETYALEQHAWPLLGYVLSLGGYLPSVAPQALATPTGKVVEKGTVPEKSHLSL